MGAAAAGDDRRDEGQQAPGQHVVHRRAGQGQRPHPGPHQPAVVEDPGQHRERGDRHRRPDEQDERQGGDLLAPHRGVLRRTAAPPARHRARRPAATEDSETAAATPLRCRSSPLSNPQPMVKTNSSNPTWAIADSSGRASAGKTRSVRWPGEQAEQARAEQDPGGDLPDHRRLPAPARERAEQRPGDQRERDPGHGDGQEHLRRRRPGPPSGQAGAVSPAGTGSPCSRVSFGSVAR